MNKDQILYLLTMLNDELKVNEVNWEIVIVGGAAMCLQFNARESTKDIVALFQPTTIIREAIENIALKENVEKDWLNDGVKGFFSANASYDEFVSLSNLKIFTASANYLLAMKCLSCRIDDSSKDIEDISFLVKYLGIDSIEQIEEIIKNYYPRQPLNIKLQYILEDILFGQY